MFICFNNSFLLVYQCIVPFLIFRNLPVYNTSLSQWQSRLEASLIIYLIGRSRLEPTAIVVLSVVMSLASFQLIIASIQKIVDFTSKSGTIPTVELPVILIAASTVGKYILDTSRGPQKSAELYKIIFFSFKDRDIRCFYPCEIILFHITGVSKLVFLVEKLKPLVANQNRASLVRRS